MLFLHSSVVFNENEFKRFSLPYKVHFKGRLHIIGENVEMIYCKDKSTYYTICTRTIDHSFTVNKAIFWYETPEFRYEYT